MEPRFNDLRNISGIIIVYNIQSFAHSEEVIVKMYGAQHRYNDIPGLINDIILLLPWHIVIPGLIIIIIIIIIITTITITITIIIIIIIIIIIMYLKHSATPQCFYMIKTYKIVEFITSPELLTFSKCNASSIHHLIKMLHLHIDFIS